MATQLLPDETGLGIRPRLPPPASASLGAVPPPSAAGVIGRRPTINMGMADVVPPAQLPPAQPAAAVPATTPNAGVTATAPAAPGSEVIGRRPTINMGAADVVQPARVPAAAAPAVLPAAETAGARIPVARALGGAGAALGVGLEGKQVYDVATNPNATGLDVAAQAAQGVGRLSAAGAGAGMGAAAGSFLGPPGAVVGGIVGGGLGYLGADRAIAAGRSMTGTDPRSPAERLAAEAPAVAAAPAAPTESGGAVFGVYPRPSSRFSTNVNDAALQRGVQATGPSTFVPAAVAVAPPAATPQRMNNLTDPRSLEFQGGVGTAPPPAPPMGEPLVDAMTGFGATPPAAAAPVSNLPLGVSRSGNTFSGTNVGSPAGAGPGALGGTEDTAARLARLQASNAAVPQGGLTVIENPGPAAAQAMFDGAALRTTLARGAPPGRNGAQVFAQQVEGAQTPIQQRNALANQAAKDAAETQRALIQERGTEARARLADARQQEANALDRARLGIEAARAANAGVSPGYRWKADGSGTLEPIPGGKEDPNTPRGKNTLTDTQAKALQFGSRMQASEGILDRLASQGVSQPGLIKRGADAVGLGSVANFTQSAQQQQVEQAQRDFINAALRRESGAAIADSEFANARQQYFPQPGDSPQVIAQKKQNRELATRGILAEVPESERRLAQVSEPAAAPAAGSLPSGMSRQVGTSGGKPVYEDAQGRRFIGG